MTEPPRPPGEGNPNDPTAPFHPPGGNDPAAGSTPPPPDSGAGGYAPPPGGYSPPPGGYPPAPDSGAGGYAPPPTSGYPPPPDSGAGAYAPPPTSGYPPPPGYPPPQYGYSAPHQQDDKTWILAAHFGGAAGALLGGGMAGWVVPLVALLGRGDRSPVVRAESVKALNFQILWSLIALIGWATTCIGIGVFILGAASIIAIVFGIIAGVKASNNEPYNYPLTVQLIK
jgi:uncharacterized Tic20 family protein